MASIRNPKRGDVVRVRLDRIEGAEQGGDRPALVLSPDLINEHSPVVLVASITSKKTERVYPFEVSINPPDGGLKQQSKVLLMQMRSIDKRRLTGIYGTISAEAMKRVEDAIKVATGLTKF